MLMEVRSFDVEQRVCVLALLLCAHKSIGISFVCVIGEANQTIDL